MLIVTGIEDFFDWKLLSFQTGETENMAFLRCGKSFTINNLTKFEYS